MIPPKPPPYSYPPFFERIFVAMVNSHLRGDVVAKSTQIGWDALLDEGHIEPVGVVDNTHPCLVIPLRSDA